MVEVDIFWHACSAGLGRIAHHITSPVRMATLMKHSSQALLLLSLVLLACSVIPAPARIISGQSDDGGTKSETPMGAINKSTKCFENHKSAHGGSPIFCCVILDVCYASLAVCESHCY
ncbi:hypothetical protein PVAP13_6KG054200 [Panicum virgatum]|uniref:Uncharacterized protein n=1 Tax=Panicum virgatum TaxID=38727 RepID=A0A8T0R7N9_PANVG|nr:hypothetical protein PVAP13_6KG054200 [Panicum virgatum]